MSADELIILNVGGIQHSTTLSTLRRFPCSMLSAMFGGSFTPSVLRDAQGHVFIDRDGAAFGHILNFMRTSRLCLPQNFTDYELLEAEADYYQIPELIAACREHVERSKKTATVEQHTGGYFLEVLEFEETAYFYRFYMPPPSRNANNGAFKSGGLVITGHKDVLQALPLNNATRLQAHSIGGGTEIGVTTPNFPHTQMSAAQMGANAHAPAKCDQHQSNSMDYPTVSVSNAEKMALFHHLGQSGWKLQSNSFSYSTDSDGSYIVHKYIWHLATPQ